MCGGRVDPFREANGDPIGPARVWLRTENIPGLAMSRSVGDLVASSVGVIPEPGKLLLTLEFRETELSEEDKFIILASDGVWEFIDNEEVSGVTTGCETSGALLAKRRHRRRLRKTGSGISRSLEEGRPGYRRYHLHDRLSRFGSKFFAFFSQKMKCIRN